MPRAFFPILIALSAVTGMVLAAAAIVLRPPEPTQIDSVGTSARAEDAVRTAVELFYLAVNHGVATGDTAPLGSVLAADYAEGDLTGESTPAAAKIHRVVLALHQIVPTLRLWPSSIIVENDTAVATVTVEGAGTPMLLGLQLVAPIFWGSSDVFRVSDSLVIERRSPAGDRLTVEALDQTPILAEPSGHRRLYAQQVNLAPGETWSDEPIRGIRVLRAASGTLVVSPQDSSQEALVPDISPMTGQFLLEGGSILHDGMVAIAVANQSGSPATFVALSAVRSPPHDPDLAFTPSSEDDALPADVPDALAGPGVETSAGPAMVASGRITLEPGARLAWQPNESVVVLAVVSGTTQVRTRALRSPAGQGLSGEDANTSVKTLTAGGVDILTPRTAAAIDNPGDSPVELVIFTVLPSPDSDEAGLFQRRET